MSAADVDALPDMLARLKLTAMRDRLDGLLDEAARGDLSLRETLALLCRAEVSHREERHPDGHRHCQVPAPAHAGRLRLCSPALAGRQAGARPRGLPLGGQRGCLADPGAARRRQDPCIHSGAGSEATGKTIGAAVALTRRCDRGSAPAPLRSGAGVSLFSTWAAVPRASSAVRAPQRLDDVTTSPGPGLGRRE